MPLTLAVVILVTIFTSSHVISNSKKVSSRQLNTISDTISDTKKINDAKLLAVAWHSGLHPSVHCATKKNFGEWNVCWPPVEKAIMDKKCVVYSFGYADSDPFADSMAEHGCMVYAFDPGMDHPLNLKQSLEFHHWGLSSGQVNENYFTSEFYRKTDKGIYMSFEEVRKKLGHDEVHLTVLKFDCEGCEWGALAQMEAEGHGLDFVDQVLIEIHFHKELRFSLDTSLLQVPVFDKMVRDAGMLAFFSASNPGGGNHPNLDPILLDAGMDRKCCREIGLIKYDALVQSLASREFAKTVVSKSMQVAVHKNTVSCD